MRTRPALLLALATALALGSVSTAGIIPEAEEHQGRSGLHEALSNPETADAALKRVLARRTALEELEKVAIEGTDLSARGRAILAIRDLSDDRVDGTLITLADGGGQPPLVRTWAASALITRAPDFDRFVSYTQKYAYQLPGTKRPIELKSKQMLQGAGTEELLRLSTMGIPGMGSAIGRRVLDAPTDDLIRLMQTHADDPIRRQAAAYLASQGSAGKDGYDSVAAATLKALRYDNEAKRYPWDGGALYIPSLQWKKPEAVRLIGRLIKWNLHCDKHGDDAQRQQVQNNLRSVQLLQAAGFKNAWPDVNGPEVLVEWGRIVGREKVANLLRNQGLMDSRWAAALDQLGGSR